MPQQPRGGRRGEKGEAKAKSTPRKSKQSERVNSEQSEVRAEVFVEICAQIADGKSLRRICEQEGMPGRRTVLTWLEKAENATFRHQYARAREAQADALAEEILEIADDARNDWMETQSGGEMVNQEAVQRSKLRVDARKWYAAKLAPKKYGDKQEIEHSGQVTHKHLTREQWKQRMKEARGE